jgi:hypothetical protein
MVVALVNQDLTPGEVLDSHMCAARTTLGSGWTMPSFWPPTRTVQEIS